MNNSGITESLAARKDLEPLWQAVRECYERNGKVKGRAVIRDCPSGNLASITKFVGRSRPVTSDQQLNIDVKALNEKLVASGTDIEAVLVAKYGPLTNRPEERRAKLQAKKQVYEEAASHQACSDPKVAAWVDSLPSSGALTRAAKGQNPKELIKSVLDVLGALPQSEVELAKFSADTLGDTHALDQEKPAGKLVLVALAHQKGIPPPSSADERRALWEESGVICDPLSSRALAFNLRVKGQGGLSRRLEISKEEAEPYSATLSELNAAAPIEIADPVLWVCENPSIISALKRELGKDCPATLCTYGNPTSAVRRILEAAKESGCTIRVQCDGDQAGLSFRKGITAKYGAKGWLGLQATKGNQEEELMEEMIRAVRQASAAGKVKLPDNYMHN